MYIYRMTTKRMCEYVWIGGLRKGTKCGVVPRGGRTSCSLHAHWICDGMLRGGGWKWFEQDLGLYNSVEGMIEETEYDTSKIHIQYPTEEVMKRRFEEVQSEWKSSETESFEREVSRIELEARDLRSAA